METPDVWTVHRQDDHGNRFLVETNLSREQADRLAAELQARGHKPLYWSSREGGGAQNQASGTELDLPDGS